MKLTAFTFIFIFSITWCYAQNDYLITTKSDTLRGRIELLLPDDTHDELIIASEGNTQKFKAFEFIMFKQNDEVYRTVKLSNIYKIMRVEIDGYLSLLSFRPVSNYRFGSKYLLKKNSIGMEVPTFSFSKKMSDLVSDCDDVVSKIEDKTYRSRDLEAIITVYNNCIKERTRDLYKTPAVVTRQQRAAGDKFNSNSTKSITELKILLKDIEQKLIKGEEIPSYMISALKMQSSELVDLLSD